MDNVDYFFFSTSLPFEINQTEIPFTSMGVFSKGRKKDFISSKRPGRPFIDFLAFSAISVLKALSVASHYRHCPSGALAWQLSSLKLIAFGVWEEVAIRHCHSPCRKRDEPEPWRWGDEAHRAIFIPS